MLDYDYLSKNDCYKIKMIPLNIKCHILNNHNEYIFSFLNKNNKKVSNIDSYSLLKSFNKEYAFEKAHGNEKI